MPAEAEADRPLLRSSPVLGTRLERHPHRQVEGPALREVADILLVAGVVVLAALLANLAPAGGAARLLLAGLVVFVAPGYLLMEALLPRGMDKSPGPALRAAAILGVSPAVVGLAALATAAIPGGFRPGTIVAAVTLACVGLAALALVRRPRLVRGA